MKYLLFPFFLFFSISISFCQDDYEFITKELPEKNLSRYNYTLGTDLKGYIFTSSVKKGKSIQVIEPKSLTVHKEILLQSELKDKGYTLSDVELMGDYLFVFAHKKSEDNLYLFALNHDLNFVENKPQKIGTFSSCPDVNKKSIIGSAKRKASLLDFVHSFYDENNKEYIFIINNTCSGASRLDLHLTCFNDKLKEQVKTKLRPAVFGSFKSLHYYNPNGVKYLSTQIINNKTLSSHLFAFDDNGSMDEIKISLPKPYFAMEHLVTQNKNNETIVVGLAINGASSKVDGVFQGNVRDGDDELKEVVVMNMFEYLKEKGMNLGDIEYRGITTKALNLNYQIVDHVVNNDGSTSLIFQNIYGQISETKEREKCYKNLLIVNIKAGAIQWFHFLPGGSCVSYFKPSSSIHKVYDDEIYLIHYSSLQAQLMIQGTFKGEKGLIYEGTMCISKITTDGELIFRTINHDYEKTYVGSRTTSAFLLNEKRLVFPNVDASAMWGHSKKLKYYIVDL